MLRPPSRLPSRAFDIEASQRGFFSCSGKRLRLSETEKARVTGLLDLLVQILLSNHRHHDRRSFRYSTPDDGTSRDLLLDLAFEILYLGGRWTISTLHFFSLLLCTCTNFSSSSSSLLQRNGHTCSYNTHYLMVHFHQQILCWFTSFKSLVL